MALELAATIDATVDKFVVTGTVPTDISAGYLFRIGDELMSLQAFGAHEEIVGQYARLWAGPDRNRWVVNRGLQRSTAASHTAGAAIVAVNDAYASSTDLTPPSPFDGGGGGAGAAFPEQWTVDEATGSLGIEFGAAASLDTYANGLIYTAVEPGVAGNAITVQHVAGGSLAVDVTDTAITVTFVTLQTTIAQVAAAVTADIDASALVTVSLNPAFDPSIALVADTVPHTLSGGIDAVTHDLDETGYRVSGPDLGGVAEAAQIAATLTPDGSEYNVSFSVASTRGGAALLTVTNQSVEGTSVALDGRGALYFFTEAGQSAIQAWDDVGSVLHFGLMPAGQAVIGVTSAPSDGDLSASQVALWFDDTDGAAKLMVKGKSANGTVVSGEVPLT